MISNSHIGEQVLSRWIADLKRELEKQEDWKARGVLEGLPPVVKLSASEAKALIKLLESSLNIEKAVEQVSLFWPDLDEAPNARAIDWAAQSVLRWRNKHNE